MSTIRQYIYFISSVTCLSLFPLTEVSIAQDTSYTSNRAISTLNPFDVLAKTPFDIATLELIRELETPSMREPFNQLKMLINKSFNSVPQVLQSLENRKAAEASKQEAFAGFLPKLSVASGKGRTEYNNYQEVSSRSSSLTASQLVYDFGSTSGTYDAADARAKASVQQENTERTKVLTSMLRAIFDLERARKNLFFARGYFASREQFYNVTVEREKIGGGSQLDVIRARTKVTEASDEIPNAMRELALADSKFKELFGESPPARKLIYRLPSVDVPVQIDYDLLIRRTPTFINANLSVLAAQNEYSANKGRLWGGINFEVSNNQSGVGTAVESKQINSQFIYRADLFSGFAQAARINAAAHRFSQAENERERIYRELMTSLINAEQALGTAQATKLNRIDLVSGSRRTDSSTRELFLMGKSPLSDVFRSQEEFFSAVQKLIKSQFEYEVSVVEFLASRGELLALFDLGA